MCALKKQKQKQKQKRERERRMFIGLGQSYIAYIGLKQHHALDLIHIIASLLERKNKSKLQKYTQLKNTE